MPLNPPITDWRGQRVWLVGASSGIGRAVASLLHRFQELGGDISAVNAEIRSYGSTSVLHFLPPELKQVTIDGNYYCERSSGLYVRPARGKGRERRVCNAVVELVAVIRDTDSGNLFIRGKLRKGVKVVE